MPGSKLQECIEDYEDESETFQPCGDDGCGVGGEYLDLVCLLKVGDRRARHVTSLCGNGREREDLNCFELIRVVFSKQLPLELSQMLAGSHSAEKHPYRVQPGQSDRPQCQTIYNSIAWINRCDSPSGISRYSAKRSCGNC